MKVSVPFYLYIVGESTGEVFRGDFEAKTRLSHRDELYKDKLRRELLGPDPDHATKESHARAMAFSELRVRLTDYPRWWEESGFGMDLFDENVIAELYKEATRVEHEAQEEFMKKADEAQEVLKTFTDE